MRMISKRMLY